MAAARAVTPLTSSSSILCRLAASPAASLARPCQHAYRFYSASQSARMSSKRKMQTSTYQPYSLDSVPPPPRNSTIPDTSIAGTIPRVNDIRPPEVPPQAEVVSQASPAEQSITSLPEKEAQKSTPVSAPTSTSTQPKAKSRPKLRPRKAAMSLTPKAVQQLRALLDQPTPKMIKVGVKNRGCSGLAYSLEYVEKQGMFDETVEQDGVKVLIDSKALFSIIGSEMDWVEDKLNQRFVFSNPNIKEQCGCGESFMV